MTTMLTDEAIMAALARVKDPEIGRDLVALNMVRSIDIEGSLVTVTVELTTPACPLKATIESDIADELTGLGAGAVKIEWASNVKRSFGGPMADLIPGVRNTIAVGYNGPLFVRGDLAIEGAPADMPGVRFRAALCRCGQSKNKPFCDNGHEAAGFEDSGAVGEKGGGLTAEGGALAIKPIKDGPLQIKGNLTIVAGSGLERWRGVETWLCRCGQSKNKPFCDGTHKKVGFKSE